MNVKTKVERLERDFTRREREKPLPLYVTGPADENGMREVITLQLGKPTQKRTLSESEIAELA